METVWKLAGSTILTPALEHCSFCLLFWLQFFQLKVNPKSTGLFPPGTALGAVCFSPPPPPLCKITSRQPRKLKITGLIAYIMFYKVCKL